MQRLHPLGFDFERPEVRPADERTQEIEAKHPDWVTPDSSMARAGITPVDPFKKVVYPAPIGCRRYLQVETR
jgi:hypothetical protein